MSRPALLRGGILVGATLLLLVALQDIEWDRLLQLLRTLRLPWLAVAIGLNGSIIVLWSLQWKILVPGEGSVTWANMFLVVSAMAMISNSVPFMVGQASGVLLLARYGGIGHASALSVYTMEQVAEGIAKLVVVVGLALFAPLPELLARGVQILAVVVSVLGVTFVVLAFRFRHPPAAVPPASTLGRVKHFGARWAHSLEGLRTPRVFAAGIALALGMKAMELGGILAIQQALGLDLPVGTALLVLASVSFATIVSVSPGNLVVFEAASFAAYRLTGVSPEHALTLSLLQHVCYLIPMVGVGYLYGGRRMFKELRDPQPPS
ncbi:MAG: flippase-like domain-containing protein [Gemmatimonadetes bacterium]|nr:flippase-like domain-containing protein [Gemmatimonadota bacterium]MCH8810263.1 flippase-like domain-containing protein [Gemmatimonadota bacterium]